MIQTDKEKKQIEEHDELCLCNACFVKSTVKPIHK